MSKRRSIYVFKVSDEELGFSDTSRAGAAFQLFNYVLAYKDATKLVDVKLINIL